MNQYRERYNQLLTEKFMLLNLARDRHVQMQLNIITMKLIILDDLATNEAIKIMRNEQPVFNNRQFYRYA